jgi:hypothetical protein
LTAERCSAAETADCGFIASRHSQIVTAEGSHHVEQLDAVTAQPIGGCASQGGFMRKTVTATLLAGLILVGREPAVREVEGSSGSAGRSADVVLEWNRLLQATIPANASLAAPRVYAMMHIASAPCPGAGQAPRHWWSN